MQTWILDRPFLFLARKDLESLVSAFAPWWAGAGDRSHMWIWLGLGRQHIRVMAFAVANSCGLWVTLESCTEDHRPWSLPAGE